MVALAPRAAPVFGANAGERASMKRPRGADAVAVAPVACGKMAQPKLARRVVSMEPSAPPGAEHPGTLAKRRTKHQPFPDQPRAAPTTLQRPISKLIEKAREVLKRRRQEEIARAREKFRLELLEVEKSAMPDETIYPEDLEALSLTAFQYAVTPTRKQALRRPLG